MAQQIAPFKRKSLLDAKTIQKYPSVEQLRKDLESKHWLEKETENKKENAFSKDLKEAFNALITSATTSNYKTFVNTLFFPVTRRYERTFSRMKRNLGMSDITMVPDTFIALSLMCSVVAGIFFTLVIDIFLVMSGANIPGIILATVAMPPLIALGVFALFYMYPEQSVNQKQYSIDTNLPFAITHMSAVASSGIPPENIFRLLVKFSDYGGVSKEAQKITRRIDSFGQDLTTAIHGVAQETPSKDLKELLYGVLSIIESGGNLKEYLKEASKISMFNYELIRKKYTETLSTFADIYTALLIAAPLFMVSILVVINIIPDSEIGGLPVNFLLQLAAYVVIPGLNVLFLMVLNFTQPDV